MKAVDSSSGRTTPAAAVDQKPTPSLTVAVVSSPFEKAVISLLKQLTPTKQPNCRQINFDRLRSVVRDELRRMSSSTPCASGSGSTSTTAVAGRQDLFGSGRREASTSSSASSRSGKMIRKVSEEFSLRERSSTKADRVLASKADDERRLEIERKKLENLRKRRRQSRKNGDTFGLEINDSNDETKFCEKVQNAYADLLTKETEPFAVYQLLINTLTTYFRHSTFGDLIQTRVSTFMKKNLIVSCDELQRRHEFRPNSCPVTKIAVRILEYKVQALLELYVISKGTDGETPSSAVTEAVRKMQFMSYVEDDARHRNEFLELLVDEFIDSIPDALIELYEELGAVTLPSDLAKYEETVLPKDKDSPGKYPVKFGRQRKKPAVADFVRKESSFHATEKKSERHEAARQFYTKSNVNHSNYKQEHVDRKRLNRMEAHCPRMMMSLNDFNKLSEENLQSIDLEEPNGSGESPCSTDSSGKTKVNNNHVPADTSNPLNMELRLKHRQSHLGAEKTAVIIDLTDEPMNQPEAVVDSEDKQKEKAAAVSKTGDASEQSSAAADEYVLPAHAVENYCEQVRRLRSAKSRAKLDQGELFYGRGKVRVNVFDERPASSTAVAASSVLTRQQQRKQKAAATAKSRSGRRKLTRPGGQLEMANYLLNVTNPDMTAPLSVKSLSRKVDAPNRLYSLKLRRQTKKQRQRINKMLRHQSAGGGDSSLSTPEKSVKVETTDIASPEQNADRLAQLKLKYLLSPRNGLSPSQLPAKRVCSLSTSPDDNSSLALQQRRSARLSRDSISKNPFQTADSDRTLTAEDVSEIVEQNKIAEGTGDECRNRVKEIGANSILLGPTFNGQLVG